MLYRIVDSLHCIPEVNLTLSVTDTGIKTIQIYQIASPILFTIINLGFK